MYPTCHSFTPVSPRDGYDLLIGLSTGDGASSTPFALKIAPAVAAVTITATCIALRDPRTRLLYEGLLL